MPETLAPSSFASPMAGEVRELLRAVRRAVLYRHGPLGSGALLVGRERERERERSSGVYSSGPASEWWAVRSASN